MGMGNLEGGANKQDSKERMKRAGAPIGAFLAGALAASAVISDKQTTAHEAPATLQNPLNAGLQNIEYGSDTSQYSDFGGYEKGGSYEFPATSNALKAVIELDTSVGVSLKASPEQREQVNAIIDAYITAHPPKKGAVTEESDGQGGVRSLHGSSYDPLFDLWGAATQLGISSALRGVLLEELTERMESRSE